MASTRAGDHDVIGGYRILRQLGRGGMGDVYLGWNGLRLVAVKVLNAQHADDHEFVKMFLAEARVAARINHTGIAQVLDVGMDDGRLYMVMEYVAGHTLDEVLRDPSVPGLLPLRITASMFALVAHALAAAHRGKVVHRDISPHNLLVSDTGAVKLIDFGIARTQNSDVHTSPGVFRGRFGYMAPEYVQSLPFDHRVDLFALGVVMWETFARQRLYSGTAAAQLFAMIQRPAERLDELLPGFPIELADVVARLLQRDPAQRHANAEDVAAELDALAPKLPDDGFRNLEHWVQHFLGARIEARLLRDREDLLRIAGSEAVTRLTMNLRRPGSPSAMPEPDSELAVGTFDAELEEDHRAEPTIVEGTGQRRKKRPRRLRREGWPTATQPPPLKWLAPDTGAVPLLDGQAVPVRQSAALAQYAPHAPLAAVERSAPIAIQELHRSGPVSNAVAMLPVIQDGLRPAPVPAAPILPGAVVAAIHDGLRSAPMPAAPVAGAVTAAIHDGHRSGPTAAAFAAVPAVPSALAARDRSAPVAVPREASAGVVMPAPTGPLPAPSDGFAALLHEQRRGVILIAVLSAIVVVLSLILGLRGEWRARQVESQVREGKAAEDRARR